VAKRFSFALNKLHLWNMTEFDRVVYLDADNIAMQRSMVEDLFLCGHFCVVYMNPCHFHTGLIVVKPNVTIFSELQANLAKTGSYDGADQGFLSEYFSEGCAVAPIFNPKRGQSESRLNVLHLAYNMHSLYHFVRGDLDNYRCGPAAGVTGEYPVATLGYPVPPIIKPWYYWTPIMGHTDIWNTIRADLDEPELSSSFWTRLVLLVLFFAGASHVLAPFLRSDHRYPLLRSFLRSLGSNGAPVFVGLICIAMTNRLCSSFVPHILRPAMGLTLYLASHVLVLTLFARLAANLCFGCVSTPTAPLVPLTSMSHVALSFAFLFLSKFWRLALVPLIGYGLHTVIIAFAIGLVAITTTQIYLFVRIGRAGTL
jgi:hypothetical protein